MVITLTSSRFCLACVAWRFWLGALSNKGVQGQRNREEIGAEATWFLFFSRLRARISRLRRSCARLDKTATLRRLGFVTVSPVSRNSHEYTDGDNDDDDDDDDDDNDDDDHNHDHHHHHRRHHHLHHHHYHRQINKNPTL